MRKAALNVLQPDSQGIGLEQYTPFTNGTFTSAVTTLTLTANPQRKFQPQRLVIDQARIGTTSTGLIQVTSFSVGADPQATVPGNAPASAFGPLAVGIRLFSNAARPGITLTLALSLTGALTSPDTIVMSCMAVGPVLA